MTIETKEIIISEELKRKVEMICRFAYVDYEFINGNIKSIKNFCFSDIVVLLLNVEYIIYFPFSL